MHTMSHRAPKRGLSGQGQARWIALIAGGTIATVNLLRRSKSILAWTAAGGMLGYAALESALDPVEESATSSVLVNCTSAEAYQFWRNLENLPRFMRHLESVSDLGGGKSRWTVLGPSGSRFHCDAEIFEENENQAIRWQSTQGSGIPATGSVDFHQAPGDRGTVVTLSLNYSPPGGKSLFWAAKLMGKKPAFLLRQDLRRFKALLETGEIPTIEGQSHGPRSLMVGVARTADPNRPSRQLSQTAEEINAARRIA